jgi:hypothetical protein
MVVKKTPFLGEHGLLKKSFSDLDSIFKKFHSKEFSSLMEKKQGERVNQTLFELISKEKEPCFLLAAVVEFIARIEEEKILEKYTLASFELWLNQYSNLSFEENYSIRAKIVGKKVARGDYEVLFPIGMGKIYEGTHFVTAHKSPDLDTTVASFWGWVDAFAARVTEGLHIWNLPGGPPASQIEIDWLFRDLFGDAIFTHVAHSRSHLIVTSKDLMSQKDLLLKTPSESITQIDHEREQYPVVVIDGQGFYLGDWRSLDVEGVRQVIILLSSCLRWFENTLHLKLISLFVKKDLRLNVVSPLLKSLFFLKIEESEPALEFTSKQKKQIQDFICLVLKLKKGLSITFDELGAFLARFSSTSFDSFDTTMVHLKKLFNSKGELIEERTSIFSFLEKTISSLHESIFQIRQRLECLDIALETKVDVFGHLPTSIHLRSDVEEIQSKMGSYFSLTVTHLDRQGKPFPVGVIRASDLRKKFLGTVSLRDFCNKEEMSIAPYLDVISVIDHHKSTLTTFSPPMAIIADVQSSNSLVADRAFLINDRYSLGGQTAAQIDKQIASCSSSYLIQRLLQRKNALKTDDSCFIHPDREFVEYLHFLYAIFDDTDLLTKVSSFDVECVVSLINRLKSLQLKKEVEILSLDDLPRDKKFAKMAAQKILRNEEVYSLYQKVHAYKEKEIARSISLTAQGKPSNFFADTKEQNGCCRVGQTKLFLNNFASFASHADAIRHTWLANAMEVYKGKNEVDLHIHMISTIVSADEVYSGQLKAYPHQDEIWIWAPQEEVPREHLKQFLSGFATLPVFQKAECEVEFCGDNKAELAKIFKESFLDIPQKKSDRKLPMAILRFNAALINSRKAMVSPYLPSIIN